MRIPTRAPSPFWVLSKAGPRPQPTRFSCTDGCRRITTKSKPDERARLSKTYIPEGSAPMGNYEGTEALIRAGFVHQARAGIFHMLPLGLRVQKKLEALIDRYMSELEASKVELSSISSEQKWKKSGRLASNTTELFRFTDRHKKKLLLSPTHEEEITILVTNTLTWAAIDQHPLRLYQITRKYRDEKRPRQGLLRAREFLMKDLYTFDDAKSNALSTYAEVRQIYNRLFDELKIPYLAAEADSGDIGGNLSHEYHLPSSIGEDCVITCDRCGYTANEEVATKKAPFNSTDENGLDCAPDCWQGISIDRSVLVFVWYGAKPGNKPQVNTHAIRAIFPNLDSSVENPMEHLAKPPEKLLNIVDRTFPSHLVEKLELKFQNYDWGTSDNQSPEPEVLKTIANDPVSHEPLDLLDIQNGDACAKCADGKLSIQKAIEVGHTFHLGTRYSKPLGAYTDISPARFQDQKEDFDVCVDRSPRVKNQNHVAVYTQMGCHGIGVSRIIGAVSSILADDKGLNWPRVIAPFEVVVITLDFKAEVGNAEAAVEVYDIISSSSPVSGQTPVDVVLDDRVSKSFAWKMRDADYIGYPVIVLLGKRWTEERVVEVQCRRLKVKQDVPVGELSEFVRSLLDQL